MTQLALATNDPIDTSRCPWCKRAFGSPAPDGKWRGPCGIADVEQHFVTVCNHCACRPTLPPCSAAIHDYSEVTK